MNGVVRVCTIFVGIARRVFERVRSDANFCTADPRRGCEGGCVVFARTLKVAQSTAAHADIGCCEVGAVFAQQKADARRLARCQSRQISDDGNGRRCVVGVGHHQVHRHRIVGVSSVFVQLTCRIAELV